MNNRRLVNLIDYVISAFVISRSKFLIRKFKFSRVDLILICMSAVVSFDFSANRHRFYCHGMHQKTKLN